MNIIKKSVLVATLLVVYRIGFVWGVGQCETLGPDSCLSAYPDCMILPIKGCCFGVGSICVSASYSFIREPVRNSSFALCLRNLVTNQVFQIDFDSGNIPGYEISTPLDETCETVQCNLKNLECKLESNLCQNDALECCQPQPICYESDTFSNNIKISKGDCDMPCGPGHVCKILNEEMKCLPINCESAICDGRSECIELPDIGLAACYLKIDRTLIRESCGDNIPCPKGFSCKPGMFTEFDCIPDKNDIFYSTSGCKVCPEGFACDEFGWGTLCTEWSFNNPADGVDCFGGRCLFKQHCNTTSERCEFRRCPQDPDLCQNGMICVQFDVTHPRVCASQSIIPFSSSPEWIKSYPFSSTIPGLGPE